MTNLTRFDPFRELARFEPFRDFDAMGWPKLRRFFQDIEPAIKLDVTEDDKAFHVKADLPGVKKEDITVQVEGNQVTLSAEVKREKEEKNGEKLLHCERYYGKQFRTFTLGTEIDRKGVAARFTEGVLELTLPKLGIAAGEKIAIQ